MSRQFQRAQLLISQRRYEDAEREAGMMLAQDPEDAQAHYLLALALLYQERKKDAEHHARQAVGLEPTEAWTHYTLSVVQLSRRDLDAAEDSARRAVSMEPFDVDYLVQLARVLLAKKQWDEALYTADKALEADPEDVDALTARAEALQHSGRSSPAIEELREALRQDPEDPYTHAALGWNHLERGERAKAMEHFREALRLDAELDWAREGAIETLKSYNPVYRGVLNFFLWMQKKSAGMQWAVILGFLAGEIVLHKLAQSVPILRPLIYPVIVLYLLFVCATWFASPLGNFFLSLHSFGRLALTKMEKLHGTIVAFLLTFAVVGLSVYYFCKFLDVKTAGSMLVFQVGVFPGFMALPISLCFREERQQPRRYLIAYTIGLGLLGAAVFGAGLLGKLPGELLRMLPLILLKLCLILLSTGHLLYVWGCLMSPLVSNLVTMREWRED